MSSRLFVVSRSAGRIRAPVGSSVSPDEILNPGGFLALDLVTEDPKNGSVALGIRVNDAVVRQLTLPTLVPERMHFQESHLAGERKRFQR